MCLAALFQVVYSYLAELDLNMNIKKTLSKISGFLCMFTASAMSFFSMWQLDMLFTAKIWGQASVNIQFYSDLIANGYSSMGNWPWTINVWLFPNFTAGISYDVLMIMNLCGLPLMAIGAYLVSTRYKRNKSKLIEPTSVKG